MNIDEAVTLLEQGKVVNSGNAWATIKCKDSDGGKMCTITRDIDGREDVMVMQLSRMRQLYRGHHFAMGPFKGFKPAAPEPVAAPETKPAAPPETK